ncbi:MAG: DUF3108 domain-containing protein [Candidatus Portiera sp.]|nr:DUF3108 domain-containing protein [Portiera sp.]
MKNLLLIVLCSLLLTSMHLMGEDLEKQLEPFTWSYDITYNTGKTTYKGTGSYALAKIDKSAEKNKKNKKKSKRLNYPENAEYTFTASIETTSKTFSSTDTSWIIRDAAHYIVPLQRTQKFVILGFPRKKNYPLTPPTEGGYYDEISVVLFLQNQIKQYAKGKSKTKAWKVWLADRNKEESYRLIEDQIITTSLGQLDCYVLMKEDKNNKRNFKVWLTKDDLYIAKVEQTDRKRKTLMEINSNVL